MIPIKCIAIDDEAPALQLLQQYAARIPGLQFTHTFTDAFTALEQLRKHPADLLLIDINMPEINGIELVRQLANKPAFIFTTANRKVAASSYDLNAIDYLVKPISFERFEKAVLKAREQIQYRQASKPDANALVVRVEHQWMQIPFSEIEYIEGSEEYLKIYTQGTKPVTTMMSMKSVMERLPAQQFIRIHRSYVVARQKIRTVFGRKLKLKSIELPIESSYAPELQKWLGNR